MVGEATEDEGGGGGAVSQDGVGIWWSQRCRYPSVVPAGACEDDSTKQQLQREEEERKQQQEREQLLRLQREEEQRQLQLLLQREEEELLLQREQLRQVGVSEEAACRFLCAPTTKRNLTPILAILGLRAEPPVPFPTKGHIRKSYMRLCMRLHPDKFKGGDSTAVFQKLQQAYDTLTEWMQQEEERKARQQQEREAQREREERAAHNVVDLCSSDDDDDLGCFGGGGDGRREEGVGGA